jgi:hypothetical protein
MSHFAQLDENNVVINVIVAEQSFIESGAVGNPARWLQTSYNSRVRKNYAGIGYTYDPVRDAFIPPKPFSSWLLNEDTCQWESPLPYPTDGAVYIWDESSLNWTLAPQTEEPQTG